MVGQLWALRRDLGSKSMVRTGKGEARLFALLVLTLRQSGVLSPSTMAIVK